MASNISFFFIAKDQRGRMIDSHTKTITIIVMARFYYISSIFWGSLIGLYYG